MPPEKKIDFVFFDAGGGHRSAANALKMVIEQSGLDWEIRLVNLQEVLDPLDVFRKITGLRLEDIYNLLLKKGWTLGSAQLLAGMHAVIRLYHGPQVRLLEKFWRSRDTDMVVSVVPNFNRALYQGLKQASPATPFVTVLTDIADYPPHFWIERQDQYLICGSAKAVEQARSFGYPSARVFRSSGMIIHPRFYEPIEKNRCEERVRLGLRPGLPTGFVMFGGQGSRVMSHIVRRLDVSGLDLQLILICGHNAKLAGELAGMKTRILKFVEGFTREVPYYMHLSDFFIGKPGPGSVSEALAMQLPVIVERNAFTLPQERYNADWILEQDTGLVLRSFREIGGAVRRMLQPEALIRMKANAKAIRNRAVFEIPEILKKILGGNS